MSVGFGAVGIIGEPDALDTIDPPIVSLHERLYRLHNEPAHELTKAERFTMNDTHPANDSQPAGDIDAFLSGGPFAVVGASTNRAKYGNKVLRAYQQNNRKAYPINPRAEAIEGLKTYADLASLPEVPHGVSIITPPAITERIVDEAISLGIEHVWMQPGAESAAAVQRARENGVNVVSSGPCVLVVLGYSER